MKIRVLGVTVALALTAGCAARTEAPQEPTVPAAPAAVPVAPAAVPPAPALTDAAATGAATVASPPPYPNENARDVPALPAAEPGKLQIVWATSGSSPLVIDRDKGTPYPDIHYRKGAGLSADRLTCAMEVDVRSRDGESKTVRFTCSEPISLPGSAGTLRTVGDERSVGRLADIFFGIQSLEGTGVLRAAFFRVSSGNARDDDRLSNWAELPITLGAAP